MPLDKKTCVACGETKSLSDFHRKSAAPDGHQNRCKTCAIAMTAAWRSNNAEHNRKYQREWQRREDRRARARAAHIKRKFGLTPEEFEAMVAEQQGLCAICQKPPVGKRRQQDDFDGEPELRPLDIDHDPKTGRVRGLLCNPCNQAIGLLRDDPESMRRAAVYVEAGDSGLVV